MTSSEDKFDYLKMYFGEPFVVNDKITIYQPTIQDIMNYGEDRFYSMLYIFVGNPTMFRLNLWEQGIDWCKVTDFELFIMLVNGLKQYDTSILFKELDFSHFKPYPVQPEKELAEDEKPEIMLYDAVNDIEIHESTYVTIATYLRTMFNIFPKVEKGRNKATKEAMIWEDKDNRDAKARKKDNTQVSESVLQPLISSCVNHPGFKYKKNELREVGVVEFMDSVQRLQIYESTTALLKGMYSGMIDTKGVDASEFNWMRSLTASKKKEASAKKGTELPQDIGMNKGVVPDKIKDKVQKIQSNMA